MATLLYRLGHTAYRRWYFFVIGWLVALIGFGALGGAIKQPYQDSFSIPGIPSLKAQEMEQKLFPGTGNAQDAADVTIVVAAPQGHTLKEATYSNAVNDLIAKLKQGPQMPAQATGLVNPVQAAAAQYQQAVAGAVKQGQPQAVAEANAKALLPLSADSRIGTMRFAFDVPAITDVKPASQTYVLDALAQARQTGLTTEVNGQGMQSFEVGGGASELLGVGVAALVLLITFGSLVAAGLPILSAFVGVGAGTIGVLIASHFTTISSTTPILATMIGLAVGIDYTLFILSRYRSELRDTDDRAHAAGLAVGKAGSAVVFAGLTVLIALAALSVVGIPFLTTMGLAAAGTVFFAVLVALTLLPAILGMLKSKAFGGSFRAPHRTLDDEGKVHNNGVRWARAIGKRPAVFGILVVALLGILAVPAKSLHLALPTDSTAATNTTQRKAADLIAEGFGPGRNGPLITVVDASNVQGQQQRQAAFGAVTRWAAQQSDVANAQVIAVNKDSSGAQILITPKSGPDAVATTDLLNSLRDSQSGIESQTKTTIGVTGVTAIQTDVSDALTDALPKYLAIVVGLAFILLMLVFRSILVPLMATLGFLLSVLATFGATVLIFQEGALGIFSGEPIVSFLPIILIGIVFGLAMDYQVFLVSRMREAHVHGQSAHEAVVDGFRHGARVVTAAAAIMISVFAAFMLQGQQFIVSMGFALAAAVFFDAFLVRMTLIPAVMFLLGERAWWLPKRLDKILPSVDVEGEKLQGIHRDTPRPRHAAPEGEAADGEAAGDGAANDGAAGEDIAGEEAEGAVSADHEASARPHPRHAAAGEEAANPV